MEMEEEGGKGRGPQMVNPALCSLSQTNVPTAAMKLAAYSTSEDQQQVFHPNGSLIHRCECVR